MIVGPRSKGADGRKCGGEGDSDRKSGHLIPKIGGQIIPNLTLLEVFPVSHASTASGGIAIFEESDLDSTTLGRHSLIVRPNRMPAVRIKDMEPDRSVLAVDLRHVLSALGGRALSSVWRVRDVWATGEVSAALESLDGKSGIYGHDLLELSRRVVQIIDGVFSAFEADESLPWVVVEAVDSSFYAVHSEDASILDVVRRSFHIVVDHEYPIR